MSMRPVATFATLALFALFALLTASCGPTTYAVTGTPLAVGSDGKITIEEVEGGNHLVKLELRHLTPPERLGHGLTTYCMWIAGEGQPPRLASVVEFDEGKRVARARATTPHHRFEVRVTAEQSARVAAPSEHVIIKQQIRHD
jgi:hypothetical protein